MNLNWDEVFEKCPTLETERCILRPPTMDDATDMFKLMGDENVTKYLGRFPLASQDDAVELIQMYHTGFEEHKRMTWIIVGRDDGKVMGMCTFFHLIQAHFRAELGYALIPQWWGKGIMSEIVPVVLDFGFDNMQLHSIMAQIDPDNKGSRRLLEKHGFVQEGYYREDFYHPIQQKFTDTAIFSLLKSNWQNNL